MQAYTFTGPTVPWGPSKGLLILPGNQYNSDGSLNTCPSTSSCEGSIIVTPQPGYSPETIFGPATKKYVISTSYKV